MEHENNVHKGKSNNNINNNTLQNSVPLLGSNDASLLETSDERRTRHYSLWIMYFTTLLQCIGGSIVIMGMWPYLRQLDQRAGKEWYGWVVAANPLGPSIFCLIVFIVANCWYAVLPLHTEKGAKWFILVARFLVGVSSGSVAACRTFVTQGTLVAERTASISHLSLAQAVGFVLGPVGQLLLQPLGKEGFVIFGLPVNMYTSVGWLTATLGIINLLFFHPKFFHESDIAIREAQWKAKILEKDGGKVSQTYNMKDKVESKIDYLGIGALAFNLFIVFFEFVLLETLAMPVSMEQFGWDVRKAITAVGLTMIVSSIVSTSIFFIIPILAKFIDERILLIAFGTLPYTLGRIFFFPLSNQFPPTMRYGCIYPNHTEIANVSKEVCLLPRSDRGGYTNWTIVQNGCPPTQSWCSEIPALQPELVAVGYGICTLGFPFCIALGQTIFSKMLGPRPQGLWMGGLTAISSFARVIGPISVTYIYTEYGSMVTAWTSIGLMLFVLILLIAVYRRLIPAKVG